ncbi:NepR family anti-sigma factor [Falsiroseomonas sp. HW251]|uniref:NepR family anti-sigma factor n=1 Tax=Falsiroseomonas sp. HW251 TaxID=3390998 RepID=UPI003D31E8E6
MDKDQQKPNLPEPPPGPQPEAPDAFDLWLHSSLHKLYDGVAREPIPPELLALIASDRSRGQR